MTTRDITIVAVAVLVIWTGCTAAAWFAMGTN